MTKSSPESAPLDISTILRLNYKEISRIVKTGKGSAEKTNQATTAEFIRILEALKEHKKFTTVFDPINNHSANEYFEEAVPLSAIDDLIRSLEK